MNVHTNNTTDRPVSLRILDALDLIDTAESFNEAIFMAAGHLDAEQVGAIQVVSEEVSKRLIEIEKILTGVQEELK
ncbi:hypothetical protein [Ferirhizobium litorale]|uniref:Uncharacterized protein n=1 Tax=Ferirhizobium litorale TaxID=2927786 RepID=A0AAE3QEN7_9HYPH|nr:hypothetical protein [Fererhizobium litorale]MDI7921753.1 hypothetical protein [Fererhizobium litorale]